MVVPLRGGVNTADIGRIASKHVKVTVSQKAPSTPNRERTVTSLHKKVLGNGNMNHVQENQSEPEEMDTREGT